MASDKLLIPCTNSAGDRKLYAVLVNGNGDVLNTKAVGKYVDAPEYKPFEKKNLSKCAIPLKYNGCDVYILKMSKGITKPKLTLIYIQQGQEPSEFDQLYHVYGAEIPKEIPKKVKPLAPYLGTR